MIRAERIELVNNHGKALAVFDVSYSEALPAGAPQLTLTDRDEVFHADRKVVLTTARLSMNSGQDEWSRLSPGAGLTFHDATGGGGIGTVMMATARDNGAWRVHIRPFWADGPDRPRTQY